VIPKRNSVRAALGAALAVGAITVLGGCSAGQVNTNANTVPAVNGAGGRVGQMSVLDAAIAHPPGLSVNNAQGSGGGYKAGDSAGLQFTIVNGGVQSEKLVSISTPAAQKVTLKGALNIPGGTSVAAGESSISASKKAGLTATLEGLTTAVVPGPTVEVTFTFDRSGALTIALPVAAPSEARPATTHS
jgi:periplasmic copper chaperone A